MKKLIGIALIFVLILSHNGCSGKTLTSYGNLGYNFNEVDHENIVFNLYHSNTDAHTWALLKTFTCFPIEDHFNDIKLEGSENGISITSQNKSVIKTEYRETHYTEDLDTYTFTIDGFSGWIGSFKSFEIKDTDEEQFYRLYPINNEIGIFFTGLEIDTPYDEEEINLDNILITIKINRK